MPVMSRYGPTPLFHRLQAFSLNPGFNMSLLSKKNQSKRGPCRYSSMNWLTFEIDNGNTNQSFIGLALATNAHRIQRYLEAKLKAENKENNGSKGLGCFQEPSPVSFFLPGESCFSGWEYLF
jgi:hypothetical protein